MAIRSETIFSRGELADSPIGINLMGTGKMLKYVAKKGYAGDWAVYAYHSYVDYKYAESNGDKVQDEINIFHAVPCDEKVMKLYRH